MRGIHRISATCVAAAACAMALAPQLAAAAAPGNSADWPTFGGDNSRSNANMAPSRITPANVGSMVRMQVKISAPIDAGLIYLKGVQVNGASHDVFFGTTNLGRTVAIDANEGKVLWEYALPGFDEASAMAGARIPMGINVKQITNSTPVADDNRQYIYAAGPDGKVSKIAIADGKSVWTTAITTMPEFEKMDSPLSFVDGKVIVPTAGYVGDTPPYQGHIAVLDAKTGKLEQVWNSLCSDRTGLLDPNSCPDTQSAIWGRAGIVHDPDTGNLLFATGNGPYNGKTAWGDSLIMLDPLATKMLGNWTTTNNEELNKRDLDMGSTTPALLGDGYMAQGGKDATIRVINMDIIKGTEPNQGNEVQILEVPGKTQMLTAPATAKIDGKTWMFVSQGGRGGGGTAAWTFENHKLNEAWKSSIAGNTPFYANGMLFFFSPGNPAKVNVLNAATGEAITSFDCGTGHWNSLIVVDNKIALPEGAISGFGGMGGRRGGGPGAPAPAAPAAPEEIPAGIVNIWHLP